MLKLNILTPRGTSLRDSAHFEPSCVKIGQRVWYLRVPQKKSQESDISPICPEVSVNGFLPNLERTFPSWQILWQSIQGIKFYRRSKFQIFP